MFQDVFIEANSIFVDKKIGTGTYASVDLCSWKGTRVAVKKLKSKLPSPESDFQDFVNEAALMRKLSHEAIVNFIGIAVDLETEILASKLFHIDSKSSIKLNQDVNGKANEESEVLEDENWLPLLQRGKKMMIVQEYMSNGTLKQMVNNQMGSPFKILYTKVQGLEWLIQIAKGLGYLHDLKPRVIHRDLTLENIMLTLDVDGKIIAKLVDFGLHAILEDSKKLQKKKSGSDGDSFSSSNFRDSAFKDDCSVFTTASYKLSGRTGSMMYMAPEVFGFLPYNEKADVFSFGIIMYEVLCKMLLLTFVCCRGVPEEVENYAQGIALGNRPVVPEDWPESFATLVRQCWAQDPADRPSMNTIVSQLIDLRGDNWIVSERPVRGCGCCSMQ
eukprot:g3334.t1